MLFYPQNDPLQEADKIQLFLFLDEESEPQMAETAFSRSHVSSPRLRFSSLELISVSCSLYSRAWSGVFMNGRLFIIIMLEWRFQLIAKRYEYKWFRSKIYLCFDFVESQKQKSEFYSHFYLFCLFFFFSHRIIRKDQLRGMNWLLAQTSRRYSVSKVLLDIEDCINYVLHIPAISWFNSMLAEMMQVICATHFHIYNIISGVCSR